MRDKLNNPQIYYLFNCSSKQMFLRKRLICIKNSIKSGVSCAINYIIRKFIIISLIVCNRSLK